MADNFPQTPGSGRNIATDQVTYSGDTADVQLVRLVNTSGAEGSRVVVDKPAFQAEDTAHTDGDLGMLILGVRNHSSGSTADGDYSAISVDSTGNMNVVGRRDLQRIAVTVTGTSTTAYTSGDQVGTLITVANAARVSGGTGTIVGVAVQGFNDGMGAWDVVFFDNSAVTLAGDNNPFAIPNANDADILESIAVVPLAGAYDLGNSRISQAYNLAVPYFCSGGTALYVSLITRTGFTNASGETLQLVVYVERN